MEYIHAFWVGGLICALVQILLDRTKLMPGRIMVLLVCTGAVLGACQLYQPLQDFAGAEQAYRCQDSGIFFGKVSKRR